MRHAPAQPDNVALLRELNPSDRVFEVRNLTKVYGEGAGTVHALRSIDLDVGNGEFLVMLGASGSGKSTLLNILGGLDVPTTGTVHFHDFDLTSADESERTRYRRAQVGFVFQFYNLIPSLTARENVELVTEIAERPLPAAEALTQVGLGDRLNSFPAELSGGEQQRVAIARALAKRPEVLLCDEPTGALDFETGKLVLQALLDINRVLHTTTIVITHNEVIGKLAHRVIRMSSGQISDVLVNEQRATPEELRW
jgi:putative ABC transport system ATP-binding protein